MLKCLSDVTASTAIVRVVAGAFVVAVTLSLVICVVDTGFDGLVDVLLCFSGAKNIGIVLANDVSDLRALIICSVEVLAIIEAVDFVKPPVDIIGLMIVDAWIDCAIVAGGYAADEFVVFELAGWISLVEVFVSITVDTVTAANGCLVGI